jgi:hypothetical protein
MNIRKTILRFNNCEAHHYAIMISGNQYNMSFSSKEEKINAIDESRKAFNRIDGVKTNCKAVTGMPTEWIQL